MGHIEKLSYFNELYVFSGREGGENLPFAGIFCRLTGKLRRLDGAGKAALKNKDLEPGGDGCRDLFHNLRHGVVPLAREGPHGGIPGQVIGAEHHGMEGRRIDESGGADGAGHVGDRGAGADDEIERGGKSCCSIEIVEKIDIGGISLIRAAAKNFKDVTIISSVKQYDSFLDILNTGNGEISLSERKAFARDSFNVSSHYDSHIFNYFDGNEQSSFKQSFEQGNSLRYGENPHQKGTFFGDMSSFFDKLHGKELSYNNLLDVDAAVNLMLEFKGDSPTFAILKHNNACGVAARETVSQAYTDALAGDPVSAFGGVLISNTEIDIETAEKIHTLFCEVVIAPSYSNEALEVLKGKKNRIILVQKKFELPSTHFRTILNGVLVQDKDSITDNKKDFKTVTNTSPSAEQMTDLEFASKICKNTKSNTIVLAKNGQLLASGTGQTSRVDALNQAIHKAKSFGFDLNGAAMASDAFFPFPDCVEIAGNEGINAVVQPGGSIKDELSINYCNEHNISMVFTGTRHFKH